MFSDEAVFHLEGGINVHNCSHWGVEDPNWLVEKSLNTPKIMVWGAMGYHGVFGPFFFDGNVNGSSYLEMISNQFYPEFSALENSSELYLMQDGAPPHWDKTVRDWLNENLPGRWIGRGGSGDSNAPWPPRSPDLTPMDFFFWGFIKQRVYRQNYENFNALKLSIRAAFAEVTPAMITGTLRNFDRRMDLVLERNGGHIEI